MTLQSLRTVQSLPFLEDGLLDAKRIGRLKSFTIKSDEYIAAVLDDAPIVIPATVGLKKVFALSGIPIRAADLLILIPSDYRFTGIDWTHPANFD